MVDWNLGAQVIMYLAGAYFFIQVRLGRTAGAILGLAECMAPVPLIRLQGFGGDEMSFNPDTWLLPSGYTTAVHQLQHGPL